MFCVIVEPTLSGHRGAYLPGLIRALRAAGYERFVLLTNPNMREHRILTDGYVCGYRVEYVFDNRVEALDIASGVFGRIRSYLSTFRKLARCKSVMREMGLKPDLVFSLYLDAYWPAYGLLPNYIDNFTGIFMKMRFHFPAVAVSSPSRRLEFVNEALFRFMLRKSKMKVLTFDPFLPEFVNKRWSELSEKLRFLPDLNCSLLEDKSCVFDAIERHEADRRSILVINPVKRKGMELLSSAMRDASWPSEWKTILLGANAGSMSVEYFSGVCSERLEVVSGYVDDGLLEDYVCSSGYLWCVYPENYCVSGNVALAVACGTPILSARYGVVAKCVESWGIGYVVSDVSEVIKALFDSSRGTGGYSHLQKIIEVRERYFSRELAVSTFSELALNSRKAPRL